MEVNNPIIGTVFRYHGKFQARFEKVGSEAIPLDAKPLREERRE